MTTAEDVIALALREVGITESPPFSNRVFLRDGTNLWVAVTGRDVRGWAWCGAFVTEMFKRAGMPEVSFVYCPTGRAQFIARHQYVTEPQRGDVAFYDWEGDTIVDHTGIVLESRPRTLLRRTATVVVVEGNTLAPGKAGNQSDGGGVFIRERPLSACRGFGRPPYSGSSSGAPTPPTPTPPPTDEEDDMKGRLFYRAGGSIDDLWVSDGPIFRDRVTRQEAMELVYVGLVDNKGAFPMPPGNFDRMVDVATLGDKNRSLLVKTAEDVAEYVTDESLQSKRWLHDERERDVVAFVIASQGGDPTTHVLAASVVDPIPLVGEAPPGYKGTIAA